MYHAVKITDDNHLLIIKWLPSERAREEFRDSLSYRTPAKDYYAVVDVNMNTDLSSCFLLVREDLLMSVPETHRSIITLES